MTRCFPNFAQKYRRLGLVGRAIRKTDLECQRSALSPRCGLRVDHLLFWNIVTFIQCFPCFALAAHVIGLVMGPDADHRWDGCCYAQVKCIHEESQVKCMNEESHPQRNTCYTNFFKQILCTSACSISQGPSCYHSMWEGALRWDAGVLFSSSDSSHQH